jgi:hypothetical protein
MQRCTKAIMDKIEVLIFNGPPIDYFCLQNLKEFKENLRGAAVKKLSWLNGNVKHEIKISFAARFYPDFRLQRIFVIQYGESNELPQYLQVYNADGEEILAIKAPNFMHPLVLHDMKNYLKKTKLDPKEITPVYSMFFRQESIDQQEHLIIAITEPKFYPRGVYRELRALNISTLTWHPSWRKFFHMDGPRYAEEQIVD